MNNIRDLFSRDHKEKIPPDLRTALGLLRLSGYEELEDRFLSTEAFLRPWSVFRDSLYLFSADAFPRNTRVISIDNKSGDGVSRLDILWFYTQFDEGTLRYDPRADRYSLEHTPNTSVYGVIDKRKWRIEEHEKHLYAWLLQEFKVGKGYNPWRFECFELKNICTVWEQVLVPIINAVRASYSPMGRRHYGRLALFIEARCPSGLAFPVSNIDVPEGDGSSLAPYRIISIPKKTANTTRATPQYAQEFSRGILTRKNYDTTEKELREVYPQYGGLVERPKFKQKMEEWLAEQRARANRRKGTEKQHGRTPPHHPIVVSRKSSRSSFKLSPQNQPDSFFKARDMHKRSVTGFGESDSPIKRYSDSIKRSLSTTFSSMRKEEQKSPLHGVTRQLHFPERTSSHSYQSTHDSIGITPFPQPQQQHREILEHSAAASAHNSNYSMKYTRDLPETPRARTDTDESVFSPMVQLSAIPRPLQPEPDTFHNDRSFSEYRARQEKKSYNDVRIPSYEGTEYEKEISLTDLHARQTSNARTLERSRKRTPVTRLPAPIVPVPYGGPRIAVADTPTEATAPWSHTVLSPPKFVDPAVEHFSLPQKPGTSSSKPVVPAQKSVAWPGPPSTLPKSTPWPDTPSPKQPNTWPFAPSNDEDHLPPPIPCKSPERQIRNPRSRKLVREDVDNQVFRIVSRENIRNALGRVSPGSSNEHLPEPVRAVTPAKQQLKAYNTNLFPRKEARKGTPVGMWMGSELKRGQDSLVDADMEVLERGKKEEH